MTTITIISKSLKIDAKTARRRLRNLGKKVPPTIDKKHWAWTPANAAKVRTLLKGA